MRNGCPRADQLTIITTVNTVADKWTELLGDCTFQFNGEIGDAAPGVDGIGLNDGPGGTDGHAGDAAPTLLRDRAVDRQGQINQQFAEEKERSGVAA